MKRFVVVLSIAVLSFCSAAKFETKIFGLADNQFAVRDAKEQYSKQTPLTKNNKNYMLNSNARTGIAISSQEEEGFKYGANISFASTTTNSGRYDSHLQKTFLFAESNFGRLELGTNYAASTVLSVGPADITAASGGAPDGDWVNYLPNPRLRHGGYAVYFNPLGNAIGFLYRKDNNKELPRKITYFTPKLYGLQLGASYIPDASNTGAVDGYQSVSAFRRLKNVASVALKYGNRFKDYNLDLSLGHDSGVAAPKKGASQIYNLRDYNLGIVVGKGGLNFAASYGNAGKSLKEEGDYNNYKEYYYSFGVAYNQEVYNVSLSYLDSKIGKMNKVSGDNYTTLKAYSLGADYLWLKGLKLYAEVTAYSVANPYVQSSILSVFKRNSILPKNKGVVFIVGAKVSI